MCAFLKKILYKRLISWYFQVFHDRRSHVDWFDLDYAWHSWKIAWPEVMDTSLLPEVTLMWDFDQDLLALDVKQL